MKIFIAFTEYLWLHDNFYITGTVPTELILLSHRLQERETRNMIKSPAIILHRVGFAGLLKLSTFAKIRGRLLEMH